MRGFKKTLAVSADNPVVSDLYLDAGDAVALGPGDEDEATAQETRSRLLLFRGSYFLDLREGVPWYQEILKKGPSSPRVRELLRQAILTHPSIVDVPSLTLSFDRATRSASVVFEARTIDGKVISSEDFGPVTVGGTDDG